MRKNELLSVILPVYNEKENIKKIINNISWFFKKEEIFKNYEIIVVNDGSKDDTSLILNEYAATIPYLRIITHNKNLGYGKALMSGINASRYPLIFIMDADGQFNINEIRKMFPYLEDYDIIAGYRHKRADNLYRVILAKAYGFIVFLLFGIKLKDINCGFKLFKREALQGEMIHSKAGVFYTEIFLKAKRELLKIKEVPIEHLSRLSGKQTGSSFRVIFDAVRDLIRLKVSKEK